MATLVHPTVHHTNGTSAQPEASADITATAMTITPRMAQDLLATRPPNRPISKPVVRRMIDDMRMGRWRSNGETLILTDDLQVLDGQHRLQAVMDSGCTITFLVAVGVPSDAMRSIDQGRSRSLADALRAAQTPRGRDVAAVCRWIWRLEHGEMRLMTVPLTNMTVADFVAQHPGIAEALAPGRTIRHLLPASLASALYYAFSHLDALLAEKYYRDLRQGIGLERGAPALAARERCLRERTTHVSHAQAVARAAVLALAWNCLRAQKACPQGLTWRGEKDQGVPFPKIM